MFESFDKTKAFKSGQLGEGFCRDVFGIGEPTYEVKSTGADHGCFVVQCWQLLDSLWKQYVIVKHLRDSRKISRGDNKGKKKYTQTIAQAYEKKMNVYVIRGHHIMRGVLDHGLKPHCVARGGDILRYGKWGIVWRVPYAILPDEVYEETERYCLHAFSDDPPAWTGEVVPIQSGLFTSAGNGRKLTAAKPEPEPEEDDFDRF